MTTALHKNSIALFLFLTVAISSFFYLLYFKLGGYFLYLAGLMWSPGIAALLMLKIQKRSLSELGWGWGEWKYRRAAYLIPLGYVSLSYLIQRFFTPITATNAESGFYLDETGIVLPLVVAVVAIVAVRKQARAVAA